MIPLFETLSSFEESIETTFTMMEYKIVERHSIIHLMNRLGSPLHSKAFYRNLQLTKLYALWILSLIMHLSETHFLLYCLSNF